MNLYLVFKSQEEGYFLTEIQQRRVLAGTKFRTCDLPTQSMPYSLPTSYKFSFLSTGPFHQRISYWSSALQQNRTTEMERNKERFQFLKWVNSAFENVTVIPPGTGVMHRVNLEYLVSWCQLEILNCWCSTYLVCVFFYFKMPSHFLNWIDCVWIILSGDILAKCNMPSCRMHLSLYYLIWTTMF